MSGFFLAFTLKTDYYPLTAYVLAAYQEVKLKVTSTKKDKRLSGNSFGLVEVSRSPFGAKERTAEPLSPARGDPMAFSPTGLH